MNDRIKLAEAMGGPIWEAYIDPGKHPECIDLPDPFTDANDDYAVLEWMREQVLWHRNNSELGKVPANFWRFFGSVNDVPRGDYRIGDYARAALEVLGRVQPEREPK